ncbi:MAG: Hsp20/alpha crystallin family protein [Deltaproteobacteria bacterium]|nr:Hsp20/alpha crystallin family protein [Deltaproteobacteria bacterium]
MNFFDENENFNKKIIKFKKEVERLFNYLFESFSHEELAYSFKTNGPPIDTYINRSKLVVEIELPGVSKENIAIGVRDNILAIMWKLEPKANSNVNFFCMERRFGKFEKFILLPISPAKHFVKAVLSNGVLKISFELSDIFLRPDIGIPIHYDKS